MNIVRGSAFIIHWIMQVWYISFTGKALFCNTPHHVTSPTHIQYIPRNMHTVFALLCFFVVIKLTDFPISIRLTSVALWQSNDCPSASKATLMNMDKYFMWIHYERLHNHNKVKHNKTECIFLGIYCISAYLWVKTLNMPNWLVETYSNTHLYFW